MGVSKGPHEECGFRLTCGLKRSLLHEGGERGTIVSHGLHTMQTIVPEGWHAAVTALVEFVGTFLPPSFYLDVIIQNYRLLVPLIAGRGQCPPGYGSKVVNQIKSISICVSLFLLLLLVLKQAKDDTSRPNPSKGTVHSQSQQEHKD
jgi:hypothetical protein